MSDATNTDPKDRIPVSLLTGFLGSGKTTLLNHLVRQPQMKQALVIINEFGAIGLDHDLVVGLPEDIMVQMTSGCLCCTIRGDLARTLHEVTCRHVQEGRPWFSRIVVETTGLADPAPILHTLMTDPLIAANYRLDGILTAVDAVNGADTLDRQPEAVKQAAVADRLLLTKTDLASPQVIADLQQRLYALNPATPLIPAINGIVNPADLFDVGLYNPQTKSLDVQRWLNAEAHDHASHNHSFFRDINKHGDHIRAICLTIDTPLPGYALEDWLALLLRMRGADILRVKGILNIQEMEGPVVLHGVQHVFHPPAPLEKWPSEDRRSRLVFIVRNVDKSALMDTLQVFIDNYGAKRVLALSGASGGGGML